MKTKREAFLFFENGDMNGKYELFGLIPLDNLLNDLSGHWGYWMNWGFRMIELWNVG